VRSGWRLGCGEGFAEIVQGHFELSMTPLRVHVYSACRRRLDYNLAVPPLTLPTPSSLADAVRRVIYQTQGGRPATVFAAATQDGNAPELVSVCSSFINRGETLQYLENELRTYPTMLTIEDFVCRYGAAWDFNPRTITNACGRVAYFDQLAGFTRYA
jgi:hypothetical protein